MTKKKFAVALVALGIGQIASAQSSVTLFGIVDASVGHYSTKSELRNANPLTPSAWLAPSSLKQSATKLTHSGYNTSRIGFRGTEDLGGGLAASFWLEAPIANDDGSQGVTNFARRSTVSLSGGFGEIRLGRDYVPSFWNDTVFDSFGTVGIGTNLAMLVNNNLSALRGKAPAGTSASDNYVRASNSVGYFLPPNLGGFYGQVQYALHENVKQSQIAGSPSKAGRYVGGRFGYANGPLDVAIGYGDDNKDGLAGFDKNRLQTLNVGASYDFGPVKLFGEWTQLKDKQQKTLMNNIAGIQFASERRETGKYTGALVGVTVPVGAGLIRVAYSRVKYGAPDAISPVMSVPWLVDNDAKAEKIAVGYVHNLSKRTALYATVAHSRLKWNGAVNPAMAVSVGGGLGYGSSVPGMAAAYVPKSSAGYDFGIRHAF